MGFEKHIGRVGALAVALGIGSAVAAMPAVASAEPDTAGTAALSRHADDSARENAPRLGKRSRPASEAPPETKRRSVGSRRAEAADTDAPQVGVDSSEEPESATSSTPKEPAGQRRKGLVRSESASETPKLITALFAPRAASRRTDTPEPDSASPLAWTMLAAARRQLGESRDTAAKVTAATTSVVQSDAGSTTPGLATQPVVIGADGTIYQVTVEANANTGMLAGGTRVSIVGPDGTTRTTRTIVGGPSEGSNAVAREDGSLLITTYSRLLNRTFVSVVNPNGGVRPIGSAGGNVQTPIAIAADGTAYLQTLVNPSLGVGYKLIRVSANNTTRVYSATVSSFPPAVAPDGSAYLVTQNLLTDRVVLMAIGPGGELRRTAPRSDLQTVGQPVIGTDGRAYWAVTYDGAGDARVTDVYTFTGNKSSIRHIDGDVSTYSLVPAGDGVYVPVVDNAAGTTSIARISATAIEISQSASGYLINPIDVTPDGTVYASLHDYVTGTDRVAVYRVDGGVTAVAVAGDIVDLPSYQRPPTEYFPTPNPDNAGYVTYTADGHSLLAVLSSDGTIVRTVALPDGMAVTRPVSFDADGRAYQVVETPNNTGNPSVSVVSASTGAVIATLPGSLVSGHDSLLFGPDGTGYLVTADTSGPTYHIVSFDSTGAVVASLDAGGFLARNYVDYRGKGYVREPLTFGPDGTAYASFSTFSGQEGGVYALTAAGATKILAVDQPDTSLTVVIVDDAGTPYVTITRQEGNRYVSTVTPLTT
ncbi:MAG: hypothetical protein PGN37_15640 [Mycobacterium kyogaense]|uniref:YncE family protein n=1 Tax=Mycobacterium kyogaense TaxID=2212479 RepID=UPI002FF71FED